MKGLYSGFSVAVSGVVIFRGLYLGGYDVCKVMFDLQGKSIWHKYCVAQVQRRGRLVVYILLRFALPNNFDHNVVDVDHCGGYHVLPYGHH